MYIKIQDVINNKDWVRQSENIWINKTTYWSKERNKYRTKNIKYIKIPCSICNEMHLQKFDNQYKYSRSYCSDTCRKIAIEKFYTKTDHMSYTKGEYIHGGYVLKYMPDHPRSYNNYIPEHILIEEEKLGRYIKYNEEVHHINKIRNDNRPENLQVMTISEHRKLHVEYTKYNISEEYLYNEIIINQKTQKQISEEIGCAQSRISQLCKKYNIRKKGL